MNEKLFKRILVVLILVCSIATVSHLLYAFYAYRHASIIAFIAGELW